MVERSAPGLREALFELLDRLRSDDIKPSAAKAQCEVARQIMETVKMELAEVAVLRESLAIQKATEVLLLGGAPDDSAS